LDKSTTITNDRSVDTAYIPTFPNQKQIFQLLFHICFQQTELRIQYDRKTVTYFKWKNAL